MAGSPPHAWGRPRIRERVPVLRGLTPTRVGTTAPVVAHACTAWAHPHTRGDDPDSRSYIRVAGGSPPHAWGRRLKDDSIICPTRLTPTRVGTTPNGPASKPISIRRAHPHTRGDDRPARAGDRQGRGSPPHAWGRRRRGRDSGSWRGLTPTRVGTTDLSELRAQRVKAHPHTRGDDTWETPQELFDEGSPPHAWGRPDALDDRRGLPGLTPTRVGTTRCTPRPQRLFPAHPHTRGDDARSSPPASSMIGSPPHAWGRHDRIRAARRTAGLTPTRVGTTFVAV